MPNAGALPLLTTARLQGICPPEQIIDQAPDLLGQARRNIAAFEMSPENIGWDVYRVANRRELQLDRAQPQLLNRARIACAPVTYESHRFAMKPPAV
jgi:hypothetical protein